MEPDKFFIAKGISWIIKACDDLQKALNQIQLAGDHQTWKSLVDQRNKLIEIAESLVK